MKKTITMVAYIAKATENIPNAFERALEYRKVLSYIVKYALFLKSPIKLSDFIPCNDGKPLEEPSDFEIFISGKYLLETSSFKWVKICQEYQKAKDNCVYQGFEVVENGNCLIVMKSDNKEIWFSTVSKVFQSPSIGFIDTHEDLIGLPLTDKYAEKLKL